MNNVKLKTEDFELLKKAFDSFNQSTSRLKESNDFLQRKLKILNLRLEKKNKELEVSLREKESAKNYLNNILESLTAGVIVINLKNNITVFNRIAEEITGYSSDETIGKNFYDFFNKLLESNPPLRKQKISKTETKLITQEGTELFISINIHLLRDARGKTIGKIIVIQDITRLKKLEEQAERRNRLMAMGELAVNIAHEIRNPLGSIELFASLLKRELKDNPDNLKLVEHIISSIKSLNHTLSNLLLFTKTQKPAFTDIDIHEFLDNAASFINYNLKQNNICLKRIYESKNPIIKGDGELLKQVFFNLTLNAIQAMPEGGTLTISTKVLDGKFNRKENNEKNINGKNMNRLNLVEIKFVDSGNGIPEGYIKSIFTPFFTTKERGTGLGLAIVHNIIDSHNGFISAKSIKGKGTEFSISIPIERFRQAKTERILNNSKILGLEKQL